LITVTQDINYYGCHYSKNDVIVVFSFQPLNLKGHYYKIKFQVVVEKIKKKRLKSTQKKCRVFSIFDVKGMKNFNLIIEVLLCALI
jgi:hypothetical protein